MIEAYAPGGSDQLSLIERAAELANAWSKLASAGRRRLLRCLVARIDVHPERVDLHIVPAQLLRLLRSDGFDLSAVPKPSNNGERLTLSIRARLRRTGLGKSMVIQGAKSEAPDVSLVKLLIKADEIREKLLAGDGTSIAELAKREGMSGSYVTRHLRLTYLAPEIVRAILDGRHPPTLIAARLIKDTRLPLEWSEQRALLGFA